MLWGMPTGLCERCANQRNWLHKHHVKLQCDGGTDSDGLLWLCANCHEDVHGGPMGGDSVKHRRQSAEARQKRAESLQRYWASPEAVQDREERRRRALARTPEQEAARLAAATAARLKISPKREAERAAASAATRRRQASERNAERNSRIQELQQAGTPLAVIAREVGCSRATVQYTLKLQAARLIP